MATKKNNGTYVMNPDAQDWHSHPVVTKPKTTNPPKPQSPKSKGNKQQQHAEKEIKEAEFVLEGTASIAFPNPHLRARNSIALFGLGKHFSGNYRMVRVSNTISASGYEQDAEVKRNAIIANAPPKEKDPGTHKTPQAIEKPGTGVYYTVKNNDNLWTIAKKFYGNGKDYTLIVKANSISNPSMIKPGQKLLIPNKGG